MKATCSDASGGRCNISPMSSGIVERTSTSTLQDRRKWHSERPNLQKGDLVLLKDSQVKRNHWPMGVVVKTFSSHDGKVRKVEVKVASGGICKTFMRPITSTVLLLPNTKDEDNGKYMYCDIL